jgi:acetylornithine deacetylase/succinyl-diaminopimelate desuccinylase family protein
VALPSENPPGNEAAVARALGKYLRRAGLTVEYQPIAPRRVNMLATLCGRQPGPTLLYCGHSDTMPITGTWSVDPHGGVIRDGRLYGRGACDMKGGLAAMAAAGAALSQMRGIMRGTLLLAAVIDEENQGAGAAALAESGVKAEWAVIAEPTENVPVIVSNGQINFVFTLRGKAGHGSVPAGGRNAIYDGVRLVNALLRLAEEKFPRRSHPLVGAASLNVGTFHGGAQTSIIADHCQVTVDRRVVPGEDVAGVIQEMETLLDDLRRADAGFDVEMTIPYCLPPVAIPKDSPVVRALRQSALAVGGKDPGVAGMRATTDAATLAGKGGIPTVVFGPGSLAQAHKEDEYILVDAMVEAAMIFACAAANLLTEGEPEP